MLNYERSSRRCGALIKILHGEAKKFEKISKQKLFQGIVPNPLIKQHKKK